MKTTSDAWMPARIRLEDLFQQISDFLTLSPEHRPDIDLESSIESLVDLVKELDEVNWDLGEGGSFTLGDFFVGACWFYADHHEGQYSVSYSLLCLLGSVYSPGPLCSCPEEGGEQQVYDALSVCRAEG